VTIEQAIETQRLRLLRLVAGLFAVVGFLSVGSVSRSFSIWACGFVDTILSRAELATRYLVIVQARRLAKRYSANSDINRLLARLECASDAPETELSVANCRARLKALQAVLIDLPRHALRLLRRIGKQSLRDGFADQRVPRRSGCVSTDLCDMWLVDRIERPPDIKFTVTP